MTFKTKHGGGVTVKMWSFKMGTHFSCYQLKTDCYRYVVVCKPYGNHKAKTYSKCAHTHTHTHTHTREREKGI